MRKTLKWVGVALGVAILLFVIAFICLVTFVSPNRFKPVIADQVMKYTGRQLTIEGDLSWTVFPNLGIKTGHIMLGNPVGFKEKTFAEVEHATVAVKLLPLLHAKVESSGIVLEGMKLNLIKNENGNPNWNFHTAAPVAEAAEKNSAPSQSLRNASFMLAVSELTIANAEITWTDEQAKQSVKIEKFSLQAKNINLMEPFPISAFFKFASKEPAVLGDASLTSLISLNFTQQVYSFRNIVFRAHVQQTNKNINLKVTGNLIADLTQQILQWTDFAAQSANLALTGKMRVTDLNSIPRATGQLQILPFDLRDWLKAIGQDVTNIQALKNASGHIDFNASAKEVTAEGKLTVDEVQVNKVKMTHVNIPLSFQNKIVNFSPITANFYQGTLQSYAKINLASSVPQIAVQGKLTNVQAEPLLQDLAGGNQKLKFTGVGDVDLQMTTVGKDGNTVLKNLNGNGRLNFNHGVLQGIDMGYLLDSAYAFVSKKPLSSTNADKTEFGSLSGTLMIQKGVVSNEDLLIDSLRFETKGKGNINLVDQQIDYHLQTLVKQTTADQKNNVLNLYGLPVPIRITGNLKNPSIRVDFEVLMKAVIEQQIKKESHKVQEKIQEQIQQQLPGDAGKLIQNLLR